MTIKEKPKRPAPVPVRFRPDEAAMLERNRANLPRSTYIRWLVRNANEQEARPRVKLPSLDFQMLGQLLAQIGRLTGLLNQFAKAIHTDRLIVTPETESALREALAEVPLLRRILMAALGKSDPP